MLRIDRLGEVVIWTIDRPAAKNALDYATIQALHDAVRAASASDAIRAAVLTGAGDAFVSGGDLRELRGQHERADAERLSDAGFELMAAIAAVPFPVIAALPGPAIGGGAELALACDLRIADERARIAFKQVRMGVTTAWGTVPRLIAAVGAGTAARLLYSACEVSGLEAKRIGLVDEATEDGRARATALEWASEIALGSPTAVARMKKLVGSATATANDMRTLERASFVDTWSAEDHRDAVEAYFERRAPRWRPRQ